MMIDFCIFLQLSIYHYSRRDMQTVKIGKHPNLSLRCAYPRQVVGLQIKL